MKPEEILEAAKEADMTIFVMESVERFTAIIEKRTIERCAVAAESASVLSFHQNDAGCIGLTHRPTKAACAAAIRKLGEQ